MSERSQEVVAVGEDLVAAGLTALPLAGGAIAGLIQAHTNRRVRKELRFIREVVEYLDDRVDRLEAAQEDEQLGELVDHGLAAAADARGEDEFVLLAAIVAEGLKESPSPEHIDRAHLLLDIVRQLQPDHVHLLRDLDRFQRQDPSLAYTVTKDGIATTSYLLPLQPTDTAFRPLVGRLIALGLVEQRERSQGIPRLHDGPDLHWLVTPFGRELLNHLTGNQDPAGSS